MDTSNNDFPARRRPARPQGFTLVELLIVISIIGLLAVAFLPDIMGAQESARETATSANLDRLGKACETFSRKRGYYPPDDFHDPDGKLQLKGDNGSNSGIESLLAFVSQSRDDGTDLTDLAGRFVNTDGDDNGELLPLLSRKERLEVADEWGVPIAYFSKTSRAGGFAKPQLVVLPITGERVEVRPRLNPDGMPIGGRKFQLLSAGADMKFGTADDLSFPPQ